MRPPNSGGSVLDMDLEDPVRALALLPKDSEVYKMKVEHLKEITRLKHQIERISQEQRLERIRLDAEQERNEGKAEAEHLAWVNEQRRLVREEKIRQTVARELGQARTVVDPLAYNITDGFYVFFDFVAGLPSKIDEVTCVYCVYVGDEPLSDVVALKPQYCEPDETTGGPAGGRRTNLAVFNEPILFKDQEPVPTTYFVLEVQKVVGEATIPVAWTAFEPFNEAGKLRTGSWALPLFRSPVGAATNNRFSHDAMRRLKVRVVR